MGDAARHDGLVPDAPRTLPGYQGSGPARIRYASNAATSQSGTTSRSRVVSGDRSSGRLNDDAEAAWSLRQHATEPGLGPEPEREPGWEPQPDLDVEPEAGWFGRRHPDLWVFGGAAIVATAAMVVAFAAASGAAATGYAQTPRTATSQAPVKPAPARNGPAETRPAAGAAAGAQAKLAAGSSCVSAPRPGGSR